MGSQEKKMEQGSEKDRGEVLRMGMLDWKEHRVVDLYGVVDGHFDQLWIQRNEDLLGRTHLAPPEQVGLGMAGPLEQDGQHLLQDILLVVQDRQLAGKDNQLVDQGELVADWGIQLVDQGSQLTGLDIQLEVLLPG